MSIRVSSYVATGIKTDRKLRSSIIVRVDLIVNIQKIS